MTRSGRTLPACFLAFLTSSTAGVRALSATTVVPKFTSSASPRFDTFSETLVGDWHWKTSSDAVQVESVQEVMRSCGGAVQGIREVPSLTGDEEGYYLNRANDGFLYFADCSYSCGPVKIGDDEPWISSFSFGKSRLLLRKDRDCEILQVRKKWAGEPANANDQQELEQPPGDVAWQEIVRCRMPSPSQPWMIQRLKWEKAVLKEGDDNPLEYDDEAAILTGWACAVEAFPIDLGSDEDGSTFWSAGAVWASTGLVKSIIRQYSTDSGSLQSVAWLVGKRTPIIEDQ